MTRLLPLACARCQLTILLALMALALAAVAPPAQARPYSRSAAASASHITRTGVRASVPSPRALSSALEQMTGLAPSEVTTKSVCAQARAGVESCAAQVLVLRSNHQLVRPHAGAHWSWPGGLRGAHALSGPATRSTITPTTAGLEAAAVAAPEPGTPAYLQQAYDLAYLSQTGGVGDTVAIVDAFDAPNAEADLAVFRDSYGLPPCRSAGADPCFQKLNQTGGTSLLPTAQDLGWAGEIALDLDAVAAICPNCKIELIEADSNTDSDLLAAEITAANSGAHQVTNSWGGLDRISPGYFTRRGVSFIASTGDTGYESLPSYPAALPSVTAAGGTTLSDATDGLGGRGFSESAWALGPAGWGAGSGCNTDPTIDKPSYQLDLGCTGRSYADISADADPATGLGVYDSAHGGWVQYGGTSLASPLIAAYLAITGIDGSSPQWAYDNGMALNDPISGSVGSCPIYTYICDAGVGYDGPTGVGSISGAVVAGAPGIGGPSEYRKESDDNTYAQSTTANSAMLIGGVYPNGLDTSYYWEYGTTTGYGQQSTAVDVGSGRAPVSTSTIIAGLTTGATYHYRLVAENNTGTTYGYDSTLIAPPDQSSSLAGSAPPPPPAPIISSDAVIGSNVLYSVTAPMVSGVTREGQTLSSSAGDWVGAPTSVRYQWQTCQGAGYGCYDIAGATGARHRLSHADVGRALRVVVTASSAGGSAVAISSTTHTVSGLPLPPPPRIWSLRLASSSFAARKGTVLALTLSTRATVRIGVSRRMSGRKTAGRCRTAAKHGPRCSTTVKAGSLTFHGPRGRDRFGLRLPRLVPGRYRATVTARNSSGSTARRLTFTILR